MSLNRTDGHAPADVIVPASVANLGGGFDTLAVAVQLYLRVRVVEVRDDQGARLTVATSRPAIGGRNAVERAFESAVRWTGLKAPSVVVDVDSDIPVRSGLGSSAAAAVAGLRIFEQVTEPLDDDVLLAIAASLEGHADNAAAALFGGLTSVVEAEGAAPLALRWQWPQDLRLVVATPEGGLATSKARAALGETLSRPDAVFNLQRVLLTIHALQSGDYGLLREGVRDRWHQRSRAALVPQLEEVLTLEDPEILASFLSGAGPSVALVARREFDRLERLLAGIYERAGRAAAIRTLSVHQSAGASRPAAPSAPLRRPDGGREPQATLASANGGSR